MLSKDLVLSELIAEAKKTAKQLKQMHEGSDFKNPVNMDMVKTTKAMFYEKAVEILRKMKKEEKRNG